jgi:predicted nucleotidyltransferase
VALQQDIADTLGVPVDLLTERELDPDLASQIIAQARPL